MAGRKNLKFPWSKKSISKINFETKIFNFSPPAPRCTFDRSGARRVRIFRTSSLPCDAGFDFFGSERAKGSVDVYRAKVAHPKGSPIWSPLDRMGLG